MPYALHWLGVNPSNPSRPPVDFALLQRQKQITWYVYPNTVVMLPLLKTCLKTGHYSALYQHRWQGACVVRKRTWTILPIALSDNLSSHGYLIIYKWTFLIFWSFRLQTRTHSSRHEKSYQISSSPGKSERLPVVVFVSCLGSKRLDVSKEVCMWMTRPVISSQKQTNFHLVSLEQQQTLRESSACCSQTKVLPPHVTWNDWINSWLSDVKANLAYRRNSVFQLFFVNWC